METQLYDFPWYLLTPKQQEALLISLHRSQNGAVLTIGPFADLDYEVSEILHEVYLSTDDLATCIFKLLFTLY